MDQEPYIGASVLINLTLPHTQPDAYAAVVAGIPGPLQIPPPQPGTVHLWVFTPNTMTYRINVPYDEDMADGTWHWL